MLFPSSKLSFQNDGKCNEFYLLENSNSFINVSVYLVFTTNWGHNNKKKKFISILVASHLASL